MHTNDINADNKDQVKCMDLEREDVVNCAYHQMSRGQTFFVMN